MSLPHRSIATIDSPEFINLQPLDLNPLMSKCEIKVFYIGENRNGSYIKKEVAMEMAKSLRGAPIVGYYSEEKEDFRDHGERMIWDGDGIHFDCMTVPYGFVSPDSEVWFQTFEETDDFGNSMQREYLMTTGYLWTEQFPEVKSVIEDGKPQSMELDNSSMDGHWAVDPKSNIEFFIINDAVISKLCILGDDVEPCFEGASITESKFTLDDKFKSTLYNMMKELEFALKGEKTVADIKTENQNHASDSTKFEKQDEDKKKFVKEEEDKDKKFANEDDEEEKKKEDEEDKKFANEEDEEEKKKQEEEDKDKKFANDDKKKDEEEEEKSDSDSKDDDEEDEDKKFDVNQKDDSASTRSETQKLANEAGGGTGIEKEGEGNYSALLEKFEALQTSYNELVEFKNKIEDEQKDALIGKFYMLSEEDKADVIQNKRNYSLDEIEAKLAVICYRKKVNFDLVDSNKNEKDMTENETVTTFNLDNHINDSVPDWVKAVEETQNSK